MLYYIYEHKIYVTLQELATFVFSGCCYTDRVIILRSMAMVGIKTTNF
jgi:hypothetical protein